MKKNWSSYSYHSYSNNIDFIFLRHVKGLLSMILIFLIDQKHYLLGSSPHFCIESVIVHFLHYVYIKIGSTKIICFLIL